MEPLFDLVVKHVPAPQVEEGEFRLLATTIESDNFLGRILTGRVLAGEVTPNMSVKGLSRDGKLIENGRVSKVLAFRGLERQAIEEGGGW